MYLQNKLPLPQFLLLENTVPDFFLLIFILLLISFFFFKKCTGCQFKKKMASELKL